MIGIVNYLWLLDCIKTGKRLKFENYKLKDIKTNHHNNNNHSNNNHNNHHHKGSDKQNISQKSKRKRSSILGDVFGENIQNALTNLNIDNDDIEQKNDSENEDRQNHKDQTNQMDVDNAEDNAEQKFFS